MGKKLNKKILRLKCKSKSRTPPGERRNWLELPRDVAVSILSRLGALEILASAQKVCMAWRDMCKDPLMWRTIDMRNDGCFDVVAHDLNTMCRHAVDRSSGNLVDINIEYFGTDGLLKYITNSCRGIRRLRIVCCEDISDEGLREVASELPLLEELEISLCQLSFESLEVVGLACPLLKSLKFNSQPDELPDDLFDDYFEDDDFGVSVKDEEALAIAATMPSLHHLQLFGNKLTNHGLRQILECCRHLESLDVRRCFNLNLEGDLRKMCAERIKNLQLTNDFIGDDELLAITWGENPYDRFPYGFSDDCEDYDYDNYQYLSDDSDYYDDYTKIQLFDEFF